jgi:hypothetical protein
VTVPGRHQGRAGADSMLLAALAAGATAEEAAETAHVSARTVRRRLSDPEFARRVDHARAAMLDSALGRLSAGASSAVDTLADLQAPDRPPSVRLGAAKAMLECGLR